jgi:hypothetical protein
VTAQPLRMSKGTTRLPTTPVAPATKIFIPLLPHER